jgi:hypothetical protein
MFIVANVPSYWHHLQPPRLIVEWALKNMLQAKKGNMGIKDVRAL